MMVDANGYRPRPYRLAGKHRGKFGLMVELAHCDPDEVTTQVVTIEFESERAAREYLAEPDSDTPRPTARTAWTRPAVEEVASRQTWLNVPTVPNTFDQESPE
jgi:hypothetical protein